MFNSKFQKVYRQIIAQQMQNLPEIMSAVQDKKEDYIVFLFQTDVNWLSSELYEIDQLYKDLMSKNYTESLKPGQTLYQALDDEGSSIDRHFSCQLGNQIFDKLRHSGDPQAIEKYIKKLILLLKVARSNWKFQDYVVGGYGAGMKYWIPQDEDQLNTFIDLFMDVFLTGMSKKQQITEKVRSNVMQYLKTKDRSILNEEEYQEEISQKDCDRNPYINLNSDTFL